MRIELGRVANFTKVLPDLTDTDNAVLLERWEGTMSYLPTLKWVRISKDGAVRPSSFPPKGLS